VRRSSQPCSADRRLRSATPPDCKRRREAHVALTLDFRPVADQFLIISAEFWSTSRPMPGNWAS
jgi:hypothetical protein